jgi:hypothetical protein
MNLRAATAARLLPSSATAGARPAAAGLAATKKVATITTT